MKRVPHDENANTGVLACERETLLTVARLDDCVPGLERGRDERAQRFFVVAHEDRR